MNWKIFSIIAFLLIVPVLIKWIADSNDFGRTLIFSMERKVIIEEKIDEIFGEKVTERKNIDGFWLGLLPPDDSFSPKALLGVVPLSGIFIFLGILGLILNMKKKKKIKMMQEKLND